jgi:hypothetical protein
MHVAAAGFALCPITPSKSWVLIMRNRALSLCALATLATLTGAHMMTPPAFACGGGQPEIVQAPPNMVVFYTATHPSERCFWQWGDDMTKVETSVMSLADAKTLFNLRKEEARGKTYFQDFGSWFRYYHTPPEGFSEWKAVGYYGKGEVPFSKQ